MEVHPPDHPILTPRDFFVHLFTITVGLLIALGLEGLVEMAHHRHLLHTAEASLRAEMDVNRHYLGIDEQQLVGSEASLTQNIGMLDALKAHQSSTAPSDFHWYWNGMQNAAWETARNTGAIGLMPYDRAQGLSVVYLQQAAVDDQALTYIHDIYRAQAPLLGGRKSSDLTPAQIDSMISDTQQAISDLHLLRDLCTSLDRIYGREEAKI